MIVVDVGNTSLHFAWEKNKRIIKTKQIPTSTANEAEIIKVILNYPKEKIVVCSVVPRITSIFKKMKLCGIPTASAPILSSGFSSAPTLHRNRSSRVGIRRNVFIVGKDIRVPIKCFYNKKQVGMDRLVCAFAAKELYKNSRVVIDFGTAITFDFLSQRGDYLGGFILPGIGSTLRVLSSCALLPKKIKLEAKKCAIPKDTQTSINKGLSEGFSSMINSFVQKYKNAFKLLRAENIIITGGDTRPILLLLKFPNIYDPLLTIRGLIILGSNYFS